MTKKEIIKLAAYEYMTQYWRDNAIYNALKEYDIYFNVEEKLENAYLEQIFHKVSPMFIELLLQCKTKKEIDKLFNKYNDDMKRQKITREKQI